jgi:hypothetical protein
MAIRNKIDSNETSAYYAEESAIGVLPGTGGADAVWYPLEPNSYGDFGAEPTLLARRPINANRQRKKGKIVDYDANGGLEQDVTLENTPHILQGFMFADLRKKAVGVVDAVVSTGYTVTANEASFPAGTLIFASGFDATANNGLKLVTDIDTDTVEVSGLTAASDTGTLVAVGRQAASGDLVLTVAGGLATLASTLLDFTTLGLTPGEWIFIGGDTAPMQFATAGNNGFKRVRTIATNALVLDQSDTVMSSDAGTGKTVQLFFGTVLKNEVGALIKRRTYHLERQLGAPDTDDLSEIQAEYLIGQVASELEMTVGTADKIMMNMDFVGLINQVRTGAENIKAGTRIPLVEADMFNTSSDIASMRLAIIDPASNSPTPFFAYVTEINFTINNNVTVNKAVGVLGGFDVTVGNFDVSAEATAYFADVAAIDGVKLNPDVQFYMAVAAANTGFLLDMPLVSLGGGMLEIAQDEPITLPLTADAATAAKLHSNLNHTLLWVFYTYLPTVANV